MVVRARRGRIVNVTTTDRYADRARQILSHFDGTGASVNVNNATPTSGYLVGGAVRESLSERLTVAFVARFLERAEVQALLADPDYYVGIWYNESAGMYHLDVSQNFQHVGRARFVAQQREELAIWDVFAHAPIQVRY